jgi:hypothetical protein
VLYRTGQIPDHIGATEVDVASILDECVEPRTLTAPRGELDMSLRYCSWVHVFSWGLSGLISLVDEIESSRISATLCSLS